METSIFNNVPQSHQYLNYQIIYKLLYYLVRLPCHQLLGSKTEHYVRTLTEHTNKSPSHPYIYIQKREKCSTAGVCQGLNVECLF